MKKKASFSLSVVPKLYLDFRGVKASLLDRWSAERGLSSCGFLGPMMSCNDTVRLMRKIRREQAQLPLDSANVIVNLATDAFLRAGGVRRVIYEIEEGVFEYDHVHLVIVYGEYIDNREVPFAGHEREHRCTRRIADGTAENNLLSFNRHSRTKLSNNLLAKFCQFF